MGTVVAAIDIGGTKIAGALVSYAGSGAPPEVSCRRQVPTDARRGGATVLETVVQLAAELADEARAGCLGALVGVGAGAAGVVDPATGRMLTASDLMPGWAGQPLCGRLSDALGIPAAALGDVQAHALGEARWGAARAAHSSLCVAAGTGVGGAYVLEGRVLKGFRGAAGHVGHSLHPAAAGMRCTCGAASHVESITSGTALAARYQHRGILDELDRSLMGDAVAARANEGEPEAMAAVEFAGHALGEAVGSWCNLFDPELVVLSGSVTNAGPLWRRALDAGFKEQVLTPLADTPIVFAALGPDAALVGAAENLLDTL